MTPTEHMVMWIESSGPHYARLLQLEHDRKAQQSTRVSIAALAQRAHNIASDAFIEATRGGDMFASDWTPSDLLDAAKALLAWELEQ